MAKFQAVTGSPPTLQYLMPPQALSLQLPQTYSPTRPMACPPATLSE
jgi:hypothetical protein